MKDPTERLLAERFRFEGELPIFMDVRVRRGWPDEEPDLPTDEDGQWAPGVDRVTGVPVRIVGRRIWAWLVDLRRETVAQRVMQAAIPGVVPVLHALPGVVYAHPPPVRPRPRLALAAAAACTLAVCELAARLAAIGVTEMAYGPRNLRLTPQPNESWAPAWVVPSIPAFVAFDAFDAGEDAPRVGLSGFFFSLLAPEDAATLADLAGLDEPAALARELLAHVDRPEAWRRRVLALAALPLAPAVELDDEAVVREGERVLAELSRPRVRRRGRGILGTMRARHDDYRKVWDAEHVGFPLAVAYHRRAARALARGDQAAAVQAIDRAVALDGHARNRISRAVILDAMGRTTEARLEIEAAFAAEGLGAPLRYDFTRDRPVPDHERARAHATRGAIALRQGDLASAEHDLRRALELHETAAHAHALGAVLFGRGDIAAAASVEARSVELAPDVPRYRWALIVSLHRLGRADEAGEHMQLILRKAPDDPTWRARDARLASAPLP